MTSTPCWVLGGGAQHAGDGALGGCEPDVGTDVDPGHVKAGDCRGVAQEQRIGVALPGAGEVPPTSWTPRRVSHQKYGAEPDAA